MFVCLKVVLYHLSYFLLPAILCLPTGKPFFRYLSKPRYTNILSKHAAFICFSFSIFSPCALI